MVVDLEEEVDEESLEDMVPVVSVYVQIVDIEKSIKEQYPAHQKPARNAIAH